MARLLAAGSAPQADDVGKVKLELRRLIFDEQVQSEKRKAGGSLIEAAAAATLQPGREVVTPHQDVASGHYQQAEFAAGLWQVHLGEGTKEYRDPVEFFRRTSDSVCVRIGWRSVMGAIRVSGDRDVQRPTVPVLSLRGVNSS